MNRHLGLAVALLLALVVPSFADGRFGGGGSGGSATSITSGTTTITSGTETALCYDDGGVITCDATSPTWTKAAQKLSLIGQSQPIQLQLLNHGATANFTLGSANGTIASPTVSLLGSGLGALGFDGFDGAVFGPGAAIYANANQDWTATHRGANLSFFTTPNDSATPRAVFYIYHDGTIWAGDTPAQLTDTAGKVLAARVNDLAETQIAFTDITTNDVSTSKHGFVPKAPNDTTKFLNGAGAYATPPGSASAPPTADGSGNVGATASVTNAGVTGTTVGLLSKINTSGNAVTIATSDNDGILGPVTAGAGTTGSATIMLTGTANCQFDGATTAGHTVTRSITDAGKCHDTGGTTVSSGDPILGVVYSTNGSSGTYAAIFGGPDVQNITNIKGGSGKTGVAAGSTNAIQKNGGSGQFAASSVTDDGTTVTTTEALSVGALKYNGKLTITDIHADNASFTVANRIHYVTTGASAIAATMPASPTVGDTYTIVKADSGAGTAVWTRAGSQTLNGATTRTVSAQYKSDTCVYMASNVWICQGDGA